MVMVNWTVCKTNTHISLKLMLVLCSVSGQLMSEWLKSLSVMEMLINNTWTGEQYQVSITLRFEPYAWIRTLNGCVVWKGKSRKITLHTTTIFRFLNLSNFQFPKILIPTLTYVSLVPVVELPRAIVVVSEPIMCTSIMILHLIFSILLLIAGTGAVPW